MEASEARLIGYLDLCPACGYDRINYHGQDAFDSMPAYHYLRCASGACGMRGPARDSFEAAREAWNELPRRTTTARVHDYLRAIRNAQRDRIFKVTADRAWGNHERLRHELELALSEMGKIMELVFEGEKHIPTDFVNATPEPPTEPPRDAGPWGEIEL
jgi:hypothetical protein